MRDEPESSGEDPSRWGEASSMVGKKPPQQKSRAPLLDMWEWVVGVEAK